MKDLTPDILFDIILKECFLDSDNQREQEAISIFEEYLNNVENVNNTIVNALVLVEKFIAEKNQLIKIQLDEVLHAKEFQKLEATWRGIKYLTTKAETGENLKLRVLNVTKEELMEDADESIEFDQSHLFKKVYEHEYGTLGGEPFICLVGDFEIENKSKDIEFISKLSGTAAAAHSMLFTSVSPQLFGLKEFREIIEPRDLKRMFLSTEYTKWNAFRESEDSRYVCMLLPRVIMREPYSVDNNPVKFLTYDEDASKHENFCWGNPAYIIAERIAHSISLYNWPVAIRGVENGGLIEDLPSYVFKTTDGDEAIKCPSEVNITDRREKELSDLGFITICHAKGTSNAVIFGAQTVQHPKKYDMDEATANANLSARATYMLAASRFAHYVKAIMRDKIGSFLSTEDVRKYLKRWLANYILLNESASNEIKASVPLGGGEVIVTENESDPGSYNVILFLKPHFQLEELTTSIRLVAKIPNNNAE